MHFNKYAKVNLNNYNYSLIIIDNNEEQYRKHSEAS